MSKASSNSIDTLHPPRARAPFQQAQALVVSALTADSGQSPDDSLIRFVRSAVRFLRRSIAKLVLFVIEHDAIGMGAMPID
jgi:hypothetical protein